MSDDNLMVAAAKTFSEVIDVFMSDNGQFQSQLSEQIQDMGKDFLHWALKEMTKSRLRVNLLSMVSLNF